MSDRTPSPPPEDDGRALEQNPTCSQCGGPHPFDTTVPSVRWNAVIRANGLPDYLCLTCIVRAFVNAEQSFTADLVGGEFHCVPIEIRVRSQDAVDAQAISEENTTLRWQLREATEQLDEARREQQRWKNAIIDAAVVGWTYQAVHEADPHAAINALLVQAQREALDPAISQDAINLIAIARAETWLEAAQIVFAEAGQRVIFDDRQLTVDTMLRRLGQVMEAKAKATPPAQGPR